jgi:nucleoporin SEH1
VQPGEELDSVGPLADDGPDPGKDALENDESRWSVISVSKVEHKFVPISRCFLSTRSLI